MMAKHLGIGLIGSGFNAKFHLLGFVGVRNADVLGVWSPNRKHAEETAALALALEVGEAKVYRSITEMVADPALDALWLCGPNCARVENVEEIVDAIARGRGTLKGVACEKPLARNLSEAKRVAELVQRAGLQNGYLEVVKLLMTAYQSAEQGRTIDFPPKGLDGFIPAVARGTWKPQRS